jgi:hypothetical protein
MLLTNQQLDKLATSCVDSKACEMLTASFNSFSAYFSLHFMSSADRVFWLSADEGADMAPPAQAASVDNDNKVAVVGPKIQACVNLTNTITCMYLFSIYPLQ